mmetsp:Transcript_15074/g.56830  ORF Transcript_15074/g.56830 Transcript_15074/m.56830 type:complete len:262 (+) Transcript_15074:568-1353(+)
MLSKVSMVKRLARSMKRVWKAWRASWPVRPSARTSATSSFILAMVAVAFSVVISATRAAVMPSGTLPWPPIMSSISPMALAAKSGRAALRSSRDTSTTAGSSWYLVCALNTDSASTAKRSLTAFSISGIAWPRPRSNSLSGISPDSTAALRATRRSCTFSVKWRSSITSESLVTAPSASYSTTASPASMTTSSSTGMGTTADESAEAPTVSSVEAAGAGSATGVGSAASAPSAAAAALAALAALGLAAGASFFGDSLFMSA